MIPAVFTYTRKPAATFFGTNFAEPQMVDTAKEGGVTVVLRVVRSFPHRNIRPLVLKEVPLSLTAQQVKIHFFGVVKIYIIRVERNYQPSLLASSAHMGSSRLYCCCAFLNFHLAQFLDRSKEAVASDASFPPPFRFSYLKLCCSPLFFTGSSPTTA